MIWNNFKDKKKKIKFWCLIILRCEKEKNCHLIISKFFNSLVKYTQKLLKHFYKKLIILLKISKKVKLKFDHKSKKKKKIIIKFILTKKYV